MFSIFGFHATNTLRLYVIYGGAESLRTSTDNERLRLIDPNALKRETFYNYHLSINALNRKFLFALRTLKSPTYLRCKG